MKSSLANIIALLLVNHSVVALPNAPSGTLQRRQSPLDGVNKMIEASGFGGLLKLTNQMGAAITGDNPETHNHLTSHIPGVSAMKNAAEAEAAAGKEGGVAGGDGHSHGDAAAAPAAAAAAPAPAPAAPAPAPAQPMGYSAPPQYPPPPSMRYSSPYPPPSYPPPSYPQGYPGPPPPGYPGPPPPSPYGQRYPY